MPSRRDFLRTTGAALLAGAPALRAIGAQRVDAARAPQSILVLGGTGFIGPHLVRHAVERGHRVTIFTRGRRQAELPAAVERLTGDRNGQLGALAGRRWDAVIDDSATNPDWVRQSTAMLRESGRYLFTSSTGVHYPYLTHGLDESSPVRTVAQDPNDGSERFGVAKAQCEQVVREAFGDRAHVVRPSYIVGPGDTTDRFPYWPVRLARGGEVLAPGRPDDPAQLIDVRDLAAFMVKLVEDGRAGTFDVAGPRERTTFRAVLEQMRAAVGPTARLTWVDDYDFLAEHGIQEAIPWVMQRGNDLGHMSIRNARAVAAGLTLRPVATTTRDTLAWWATVPEARRTKPRFSITPEQEARALAAWHARRR